MPGRERYLQIKAARVGVGVYDLARKIQPVYELRLHGFRVKLRGLYAARGDYRLLCRAKIGDGHGKVLEQISARG